VCVEKAGREGKQPWAFCGLLPLPSAAGSSSFALWVPQSHLSLMDARKHCYVPAKGIECPGMGVPWGGGAKAMQVSPPSRTPS